MKNVSKVLAVLLSVCMLFSLIAISASASCTAVPNKNFKQPTKTINQITSRPSIDGKLTDNTWKQATKFPFTQDTIKAGDGQLWSYTEDGLLWEDLPSDIGGDCMAYIGWDKDYIYFALEVEDEENENTESLRANLWKGDCVQVQIGADTSSSAVRYEFGFALSSFGGTRRLGYQWWPTGKELDPGVKQNMATSATEDYYYFVENKSGKTTYEIALKTSAYARTTELKQGDKLPFSFTLHWFYPTPDKFKLNPDDFNGYFMEYAKGISGGDDTKLLSTAAVLTLGKAGTTTGGDNGGEEEKTTTTKKPTTTKAPTTTQAPVNTTTGNTPVNTTTQAPVNTTTEAPVTTTEAPTTTTEATTTTTEVPEIEGTEFFDVEKATDVEDEDTVAAIKKDFEDKEIAIQKYVATEKKFGVSPDFLEGVYVKDEDGKFVALEGKDEEIANDDGSTVTWKMFEVDKDAELYIVKMVPPTTTTTEAPTTTTEAPTTTTKADDANVGAEDEGEKESSFPWWIIIVIVAVVAIALILFFVLKKKKEEPAAE